MTMRLEEQAKYKWSVDTWQIERAIKNWKEKGILHLSGTPTYHAREEIEWTQEREEKWLFDVAERIKGNRWVAYGQCRYETPVETKINNCSHRECIPSDDPIWAVKLFYAMVRQNNDDEREREADRQTYWNESGTPLHERY